MNDLPKWVWDILADLVEYEGNHAAHAMCLETIFERAPAEARTTAAVLVRYRRDSVVAAEIVEDPA